MNHLLLGLDIGTSSVKGVVCDTLGKILAQAELPNRLKSARIGWAEQSVEQWQENTIRVIQSCVQQLGVNAANISGMGVSGMVPALVILDAQGNVLREAIQYNDARAGKEILTYTRQIGAERFFQITGASLSAQSIGPKWNWLLQNEPEVCARAASLMGSYDYINTFLTGNRCVERNWALESGLYDLHAQAWSQELAAVFGIDAALLPPVVQPTDITGSLLPEIARLCGLPAGIPVAGGSADHVAAALAAGITHAGDVLIKFGSSGDILYCSDELVSDPRLYLDYHNIPGKYLPNGCMATSGSLLKWVVEQFFESERAESHRNGSSVFQQLDEQARLIPPGSDGVIVLPYFLGAKTPLNDTQARGLIYGLQLSHNRLHIYRAVLEAVVFGFRHHFEVLKSLGLPIRRVLASEGGAKSELWRQIAADILDMPVHYLKANPGSAYGAAVVAGMATRALESWDLVEQGSEWGLQMTPEPQAAAAYDAHYRLYRSLYPALKDIFNR